MNVEPWWGKANPKVFESLHAPRSGHATTTIQLLLFTYVEPTCESQHFYIRA